MSCCHLTGTLTPVSTLTGTLRATQSMSGSLSVPQKVEHGHYNGRYEVVPTNEDIILETNDLVMDRDLVVKKIPSCYGLITWDGNKLRIS